LVSAFFAPFFAGRRNALAVRSDDTTPLQMIDNRVSDTG
jgi:hypothetical protein